MDSYVKLASLSQGRDKIFRTTQYACILLNCLIHKHGSNKELAAKLKHLESNLSSGRKLFRLGNTVDAVQTARRNVQISDPVLRFCLTAISLSRALYYICDNILWSGAVGLGDIDKEKWSKRCNHYYFFSLVVSLGRDVYEVVQLMKEEVLVQKRQASKSINNLENNRAQREFDWIARIKSKAFLVLLFQIVGNNPPVLLDIVKNLCDLTLPLDKMGICKTNSGVVGFCGLLSSILSILALMHPALKLKA
ncbi:peroxisomal membrane protein 11A [Leucoraja erinacea]|uniref:peroxisomal membrane protein 11A n=1 Tax=Leucoraja erinaceus TaxID=7782 RepID=UPI0024551BF6|nr:peroxisomal membrane protein 11A [Leucoraja erinacea]XP_055517466.1 peroxisomal membrane protein 11A [Leucoraja erinacea]XP_055517467.1 peroxisomal membrane protein 11A [Leucoraja erinacea]XP_055517468.1 peroxisomal membrane protein 11A [Leucoraja erinacea]